jgi:hypothetical protein
VVTLRPNNGAVRFTHGLLSRVIKSVEAVAVFGDAPLARHRYKIRTLTDFTANLVISRSHAEGALKYSPKSHVSKERLMLIKRNTKALDLVIFLMAREKVLVSHIWRVLYDSFGSCVKQMKTRSGLAVRGRSGIFGLRSQHTDVPDRSAPPHCS